MMESRTARKIATGGAAFSLAMVLTAGAASCSGQNRETSETTNSDTVKLEKIIEASGRTTVGACLAENDSPYSPEDISFLSWSEGYGRRNPDTVFIQASDGSSEDVLALEIERDTFAQISQFSAADGASEKILIKQGCHS